MATKNELKLKRARRIRRKYVVRRRVFGNASKPRLTVFRSNKNISCQLIDDFKRVTLASASTLSKELAAGGGGNCKAAAVVGAKIAEKAKSLGITEAQFDRNGYKFHGRLRALVDAAREGGLKI